MSNPPCLNFWSDYSTFFGCPNLSFLRYDCVFSTAKKDKEKKQQQSDDVEEDPKSSSVSADTLRTDVTKSKMDHVKRIWYLLPMRAAKVQVSLRIRAVSPEPSLLAHTSRESRGTFRQKARSLAALNGWACAVKICHDGMLEDTNSLDGAQICFKMVKSSTRNNSALKKHTCVSTNPTDHTF